MSGKATQTLLTATAEAVYTATGTRAQIVAADVFEVASAGDTVTVYIVPDGETTASTVTAEFTQGLAADAQAQLSPLLSHYLNPGDAIWAMSGVTDQVVMRVSVVDEN